MSKELEALDRIIETFYDKESDDIKLVKAKLKRLEELEKEREMEHTLRIRLENINYKLVREKQENDKKLKALEIIKATFKNRIYEDNGNYFMEIGYFFGKKEFVFVGKRIETIEEYDLLKEIM